jgi:hypothetical protein
MAPHGTSGGILLRVDLSVFDIGAIDEGNFYVKFTLTSQLISNLSFILFMDRPKYKTKEETLPFIIGGDFNIMRKPEDKSSGDFDNKWPSLFNVVIESLDLREIVMTCRQYTWAGSGDNPTYEKLDRVLVSTE